MNKTIAIKVNGVDHEVTIAPRVTLIEVLRDHLHLTGTKLGCDQEVCGACTVLLDDLPVSSCSVLGVDADGCHLGQKDIDITISRKILGKKKVIGVTCHNSKNLALKAKKHSANYVAFGSFFKSRTKKTAFKANLAILRWAKKKISMPTVAIGGINSSNYKKILSNGADYIACSNYVWNNKKLDPVSAISKFK